MTSIKHRRYPSARDVRVRVRNRVRNRVCVQVRRRLVIPKVGSVPSNFSFDHPRFKQGNGHVHQKSVSQKAYQGPKRGKGSCQWSTMVSMTRARWFETYHHSSRAAAPVGLAERYFGTCERHHEGKVPEAISPQE